MFFIYFHHFYQELFYSFHKSQGFHTLIHMSPQSRNIVIQYQFVLFSQELENLLHSDPLFHLLLYFIQFFKILEIFLFLRVLIIILFLIMIIFWGYLYILHQIFFTTNILGLSLQISYISLSKFLKFRILRYLLLLLDIDI